jgi:hypothetical protein
MAGQNIERIYIIESDKRVGPWTVGESLKNLTKKTPKDWSIEIDSMDMCEGCFDFYTVYNIQYNNEYLLTIEPDWETKTLDRFWIRSKKFKTNKGFHIGMNVKELRRLYTIDEIYTGGEIGIAVVVENFKGSFKINPNDYNGDLLKLNKNNLPDDLVINEIIIAK